MMQGLLRNVSDRFVGAALLCLLIACLGCWFFVDSAAAKDSASAAGGANAADTKAFTQNNEGKHLANGIYLVLRQGDSEGSVMPLSKSERLLVNDYRFLDVEEREKPLYLVVSEDEFVPLKLGDAPDKGVDDKGKPKIQLKLAKNQIVPLEKFTTKYTGRTIALVVGAQVVSAHKIRMPITGGKIQISWCGGNACKALLVELEKEAELK